LRLKQLFDNPNDPKFDRRNIAVGNYTPIQSFYAQDQNNATDLRKNANTNATNVVIGDRKNASDLAKLYATPVIVGDGQTAFLPGQTAEATGLPRSCAATSRPSLAIRSRCRAAKSSKAQRSR
jgi:hypothetical protein